MGKRKYKRLHYEDRQTIEAMSKQGSSVSDIAEALGTHRDTIYREFKRCNATLKTYTAGKNSEPVTDEQVAAQMQQAEPLVIETPEAATEGSIRVYDYDGCCIYSYYGKIRINSDGKDGKEIDVEALGYLEGYQEHKEESGAGE